MYQDLSALATKKRRSGLVAYPGHDPLALPVILMTLAKMFLQFIHVPSASGAPPTLTARYALSASLVTFAVAFMGTALRHMLIFFSVPMAIPLMRLEKSNGDPIAALRTTLAARPAIEMCYLYSKILISMTIAIASMKAWLIEWKRFLVRHNRQHTAHPELLVKTAP